VHPCANLEDLLMRQLDRQVQRRREVRLPSKLIDLIACCRLVEQSEPKQKPLARRCASPQPREHRLCEHVTSIAAGASVARRERTSLEMRPYQTGKVSLVGMPKACNRWNAL
jgi:hypothetical protein